MLRTTALPLRARPYRFATDALPPRARLQPLRIRMANGQEINEASHEILRIEIGGVNHRFALHQHDGDWRVTDVASGLRVLSVQGYLHGFPVSAAVGFTRAEIRRFAVKQVHALAARIGVEAFNSTVAAGVPTNTAPACAEKA